MSHLTSDKLEALDEIEKFLMDPEKQIFILSGGPGTGKTFLVPYIQDIVKKVNEFNKLIDPQSTEKTLCLTATTNSAAANLSNIAKENVRTIHSFLSLTPYNGTLQRRKNVACLDLVVLIDEYTMIDVDLREFIHSILLNNGTNKVILVGDPDQFLAVRHSSPTFSTKNANFSTYELTQINRTKVKEIQDNYLAIRSWLRDPDSEASLCFDGSVVRQADDLKHEFKELLNKYGSDTSKYGLLTYSNRSVLKFNDLAREVLNLPSNFEVGETVVINSSFRAQGIYLPTDCEVVISTYDGSPFINDIEIDTYTVKLPDGRATVIATLANPHKYSTKARTDINNTYGLVDARSRYSRTLYKAQGTSVDHVLLDLASFPANLSRDTLLRALYVAFSRARESITVVGELNDTLLGKL